MPFLLAEILNFQGSTHRIGVGSFSYKEKNQKLREKRPMFDSIRPWYDWKNATEEEKQKMATALENGVGFI